MKTILVVDDDNVVLKTAKMFLHNDYNVILASSGIESIDIAKNCAISLILMDINMPYMDGIRAASAIKANKKSANIPIVFLTSAADRATVEKCISIGASGYIVKPFHLDILLEKISRVLNNEEVTEELTYSSVIKETEEAQKHDVAEEVNNFFAETGEPLSDGFGEDLMNELKALMGEMSGK